VEFADIKKKNVDVEKEASNGYVAMVQHYFASAWILPDGVKRSLSLDAVDIGSAMPDCCYRATMIAPLEAIAPGATKVVDAKFFAGPQEEKMLESLAPGLELVKDYGTVISRTGAGPLLRWCYCSKLRSTGSMPKPTPAWPR
jgi:YidC/Oxa1 family membrane protein insertase